MAQIPGRFFFNNDEILPAPEYDAAYIYSTPSVYEVIRIIDGIPVFFQEHCERFLNSCKINQINHNLTASVILDSLKRLIEINEFKTGNIKLVLIQERKIRLEECFGYQSMFLSGTSRKILPVRLFNDHTFNVGHILLKELIIKFDQILSKYLRQFNQSSL